MLHFKMQVTTRLTKKDGVYKFVKVMHKKICSISKQRIFGRKSFVERTQDKSKIHFRTLKSSKRELLTVMCFVLEYSKWHKIKHFPEEILQKAQNNMGSMQLIGSTLAFSSSGPQFYSLSGG